VRDEYVSIEGARRDYGGAGIGDPIANPEGLCVDPEATQRLRGELQARRPALNSRA
jgi:N-methylhydantoinase B